MAQLGGKSVRTLITSLEVLSDDGDHVLMVDAADGMGNGGVKFRFRRPWEDAWGSYPTFTLDSRDAEIVAKLVGNTDASYSRTSLDAISSSDFRRDNPNPTVDEQAARDEEARCAELDIERARAANIQQEFILDHSRLKHGSDIPGCPSCEARIRPGYGDGSLPPLRDYGVSEERNTITATGEGDEGDVPF